jgi:hypothetical protein
MASGGFNARPLNMVDEVDIGNSKPISVQQLQVPGNFTSILAPRAHDSKGSQVLTVTLGVSSAQFPPGGAVNSQRIPVIARIEWGVGSARFHAFVDVRNGTQFSVLGSQLSVDAGFSEIDLPNTPASVSVSAGFSFGTRPGAGYVTYTAPRISVTNAAPVDVAVPPYAQALQAFSPTPGFGTLGLITAAILGGRAPLGQPQLTLTEAQLSGALTFEGVRLPATAQVVRFTSTAPAAVFIVPTFVLSL